MDLPVVFFETYYILFLGPLSSLGGIVAHVVFIRFGLPKRWFVKALLALSFFMFGFLGSGFFSLGVVPSFEVALIAFIMTFSTTIAYLFLFIGVMYDSPTLAIISTISNAGSKGLPINLIPSFIDSNPFVASRLTALQSAGLLMETEKNYICSVKLNLIVKLSDFYFRLCRINPSKG